MGRTVYTLGLGKIGEMHVDPGLLSENPGIVVAIFALWYIAGGKRL